MRHRWRRGRGRLAQEIFRVRAAHAKIAAARLALRVVVAMAVAIDAPDRILAMGAARAAQRARRVGDDLARLAPRGGHAAGFSARARGAAGAMPTLASIAAPRISSS